MVHNSYSFVICFYRAAGETSDESDCKNENTLAITNNIIDNNA